MHDVVGYIDARTEAEVVSALCGEEEGARILGGGTDLLVQLREGRRRSPLLVDIKAMPAANVLDFDPRTGLRLGAAVPCYRICSHPAISAAYPGLVDAISLIGGTQIQGRATVGGNLCNASPAADSIPALIVHGAICVVAGPDGHREVPVENFCVGPGQTILERGEFLLELRLPSPVAGFGAGYLRFIPRNEMDIAVTGAAVAVVLDQAGTHIASACIALGAVAPTPLLVTEAGGWLAGRPVTDEVMAEAARLAQAAARPISDVRGTADQRRHLAGVLTRRALARAIERARSRGKQTVKES